MSLKASAPEAYLRDAAGRKLGRGLDMGWEHQNPWLQQREEGQAF
jgi:hypothetical protein